MREWPNRIWQERVFRANNAVLLHLGRSRGVAGRLGMSMAKLPIRRADPHRQPVLTLHPSVAGRKVVDDGIEPTLTDHLNRSRWRLLNCFSETAR